MSLLRLIAVSLLVFVASVTAMAAPIPPEVRKSIVFLYLPVASGSPEPLGTAFFLGYRDSALPDRPFAYLVTAKHVLQRADRRSFLPEVLVRVNSTAGEAGMASLPIVTAQPGQTLLFHDDPSVDLAVADVSFDPERDDILPLSTEFLTTREDVEKYGLSEGTDVFFTGLFVQHVGAKRNLPIVRFGKVALLTDEPINFDGVLAKLYLMEANTFGGNSGSPVFFYTGIDHPRGGLTVFSEPFLRIAGVVSGRFNDILPVGAVQTKAVPAVAQNNGIMAVVPAYQLREIIFGPVLTERRRQTIESMKPRP